MLRVNGLTCRWSSARLSSVDSGKNLRNTNSLCARLARSILRSTSHLPGRIMFLGRSSLKLVVKKKMWAPCLLSWPSRIAKMPRNVTLDDDLVSKTVLLSSWQVGEVEEVVATLLLLCFSGKAESTSSIKKIDFDGAFSTRKPSKLSVKLSSAKSRMHKLSPSVQASCAMSVVLPVPGGPCSK